MADPIEDPLKLPAEKTKKQSKRPDERRDKLTTGSTVERGRVAVSASAGSRLDTLRSAVEVETGENHEMFYQLGEHQTDTPEVREMRKLKPYILVGSVDSTEFARKWHEPEWYKPYINAAVKVDKCYKLLDSTTKQWFDKLKPAIDLFISLGTLDEGRYRKEYKKEIYRLVKSKGDKFIYGSEGALNFLLAFRRIMNIYPDLDKVADKDFKWDDFPVSEIKLSVGAGKGKEGGKLDRRAYMLVKKEKPVDVTAVVEPDQRPDKHPQSPVIPEFDTPEFYAKYEISDSTVFQETLKPLDIWLVQEKWEELNDPKFWEKLGVPGSAQRKSNVRRFFEFKKGAVSSLVASFSTLSTDYPKFFTDMENPKSKKYRDLFELTMQRLLEYYKTENFNSDNIQLYIFETLDVYIENEDLDKGYRKSLIEKAIAYAVEMKSFDTGNLDDWEELETGYREKLKEFES